MNREQFIKIVNQHEKKIVFLILFVIILILRLNYDFMEKGDKNYRLYWDHYYYIMMAKDMSSIFQYKVQAPFCYRILLPFIAWILPLDIETSFYILNFLGVYLTGVVLYLVLKLHFNNIISFIGLIMFCSLHVLEEIFYEIYYVDSMASFFLMMCFYCILTSRYKLFSLNLVLGVLTKEIVLFTIPVFLIYGLYFNNDAYVKIEHNRDFYIKFLRTLTYILPALIIFILIRIIVKPAPGDLDNYGKLIILVIGWRIDKLINEPIFYYCLIEMWGLIPLLFCCFNNKERFIYWLRVYGIFMCLVYFQTFIATKIDRLLYIGFYPIIYLSLSGLCQLIQKLGNTELIKKIGKYNALV